MSTIPEQWNLKFKSVLNDSPLPNGLSIPSFLYEYYFSLSITDAYVGWANGSWTIDIDDYNYCDSFLEWINHYFSFNLSRSIIMSNLPSLNELGEDFSQFFSSGSKISFVHLVTNILMCFFNSDGTENYFYLRDGVSWSGQFSIMDKIGEQLKSTNAWNNGFDGNRFFKYWTYSYFANSNLAVSVTNRFLPAMIKDSNPIQYARVPIFTNVEDAVQRLKNEGIYLDPYTASYDKNVTAMLSEFVPNTNDVKLFKMNNTMKLKCDFSGSASANVEYDATKPTTGSLGSVNIDCLLGSYLINTADETPYSPAYYLDGMSYLDYAYPDWNVNRSTNTYTKMNIEGASSSGSDMAILSNNYVKVDFTYFSTHILSDNWLNNIADSNYETSWDFSKFDIRNGIKWSNYGISNRMRDAQGNYNCMVGPKTSTFTPTVLVQTGASIFKSTTYFTFLDLGFENVPSSYNIPGTVKASWASGYPNKVYFTFDLYGLLRPCFSLVKVDESSMSKAAFKNQLLNGITKHLSAEVQPFNTNMLQSDISVLNSIIQYSRCPYDIVSDLKNFTESSIQSNSILIADISKWTNNSLDFTEIKGRVNASGGNYLDAVYYAFDENEIVDNGVPISYIMKNIVQYIKDEKQYTPNLISNDNVSSVLSYLSSEYIADTKRSLKQEIYTSILSNSTDQDNGLNNVTNVFNSIRSQYDREYNALINSVSSSESKRILSSLYLDMTNWFSEFELSLNNSDSVLSSTGDIYSVILQHDANMILEYEKRYPDLSQEELINVIPEENLYVIPHTSRFKRAMNMVNDYVISPTISFISDNIAGIVAAPVDLLRAGIWWGVNYLASDGRAFTVNKKYSHGVLGAPLIVEKITIPSYIANNLTFINSNYGSVLSLPFTLIHIQADPYATNEYTVSFYMRLDHVEGIQNFSDYDIMFLNAINNSIPGLVADINMLHMLISNESPGQIFTNNDPIFYVKDNYKEYISAINEHDHAILSPKPLNSITDIMQSSITQYLDNKMATIIGVGAGCSCLSIALLPMWPVGTLVGTVLGVSTIASTVEALKEYEKLANTSIENWKAINLTEMNYTIDNYDVSRSLSKFADTFSDLTSYGSELYVNVSDAIEDVCIRCLAVNAIDLYNRDKNTSITTSSKIYSLDQCTSVILPRYYLTSDEQEVAKVRNFLVLVGAALALVILKKPVAKFISTAIIGFSGILTGAINKAIGSSWATKALSGALNSQLPGLLQEINNPINDSLTNINGLLEKILSELSKGDVGNNKPLIIN